MSFKAYSTTVTCQQQLDRSFMHLNSVYFCEEWAAFFAEHSRLLFLAAKTAFGFSHPKSMSTFGYGSLTAKPRYSRSLHRFLPKLNGKGLLKVKGHTHMCSPHPPSPEPERGWSIPPAHRGGRALKPQPAKNSLRVNVNPYCIYYYCKNWTTNIYRIKKYWHIVIRIYVCLCRLWSNQIY